ncbi:hypothetical protein PMAYCL1PPCAC_13559 [Pristionchus mayeri]|uniref:Uncharacterized protein n=1 Tax=Pristionchus mayeri TaxID=1317129 RepID=A0AAN4ZQ58_9BILA|nr:hypothetical protein PMAYCL1PPCAC_13559 [Pristionchus mayeri]
MLNEDKKYTSDYIRRISQNASFGELTINLDPTQAFNREAYKFAKNLHVDRIIIDVKIRGWSIWMGNLINGTLMLDLSKVYKHLEIPAKVGCISGEDYHELYKNMIDGSSKCQTFVTFIGIFACTPFLTSIGITFRNGRFFSNRDIKAFIEPNDRRSFNMHFFDGNLEIFIAKEIFFSHGCGVMRLHLHESQESLERTKLGLFSAN